MSLIDKLEVEHYTETNDNVIEETNEVLNNELLKENVTNCDKDDELIFAKCKRDITKLKRFILYSKNTAKTCNILLQDSNNIDSDKVSQIKNQLLELFNLSKKVMPDNTIFTAKNNKPEKESFPMDNLEKEVEELFDT